MFVHPHFVYLDMQTEWTLKNITFTWLTQIPTRWWWIVLQISSVNNNVSSLIVGLFPILGKENKSRAITLKLRGPCQKPTFLGPNDHFCGCIANKTKPKTISGHFEINKCSKTSISSYFSHSPSHFPYSPCLSLTHCLPVKHPVHVIKKNTEPLLVGNCTGIFHCFQFRLQISLILNCNKLDMDSYFCLFGLSNSLYKMPLLWNWN